MVYVFCSVYHRLLVGAPFERNGENETGDVYKCLLDSSVKTICSRLNLGILWIPGARLFSHQQKSTVLNETNFITFFTLRRDNPKKCV